MKIVLINPKKFSNLYNFDNKEKGNRKRRYNQQQ